MDNSFRLYMGFGLCSFTREPKKICNGKIKFKGESALDIGFKEFKGNLEELRFNCHLEIDRFFKDVSDYTNKIVKQETSNSIGGLNDSK